MAKPNAGPCEIEIKLRLPPGGEAALEALPMMRAAAPERRDEVSTYYDTPGRTLHAQGLALRVRRSGNRHVQTLKSAAAKNGPAGSRGEWEWEVESEAPDLALLSATPFAGLVGSLGSVRPVFSTYVRRTARLMRLDSATSVETALDRGEIVAGSAREELSEFEVELKEGDVAPLYRFALDLVQAAPMWLAPESKSARGYRLLTGERPTARHAGKLELPAKIAANAGFRAVIEHTLEHLLANIPAVEAEDPEGVHQLRVGLRRLRTALVLFQPMLAPESIESIEPELKRLGRIFGARRDADVLCLETLPRAAEALGANAVARLSEAAGAYRAALAQPMLEALKGPGLTRLVLGLAAWCEDGLRDPAQFGPNGWDQRLARPAPDLLDRLARKVRKRARHIDNPERLHGVRKSMKKLRYSVEFLAGLYPAKAVKRYRRHCEALQTRLGEINDARTAPVLLDAILGAARAEHVAEAAALALWSGRREQQALDKLGRALRNFAKADPFWA
jgi:inorganic triphosphatase YgiF